MCAASGQPGVLASKTTFNRRFGGEYGYRAVTWAERSEDRQLVGYYRNLRAATMAENMHFVAPRGEWTG